MAVRRHLTIPLRNVDNEFLRTFFVSKSEPQTSGLFEELGEGVFYSAIKSPSVALMRTLW